MINGELVFFTFLDINTKNVVSISKQLCFLVRNNNMKFIHALTWAFAAIVAATERQLPLKHGDQRPNIVIILTDDQDLHMDSLSYMPLLKKHITDQGTFYKSHYCTTAICCPSRVTLWTGRNAHNTNVTDVFPPHGE